MSMGRSFQKACDSVTKQLEKMFNKETAAIIDQHASGSLLAGMVSLVPGAGPTICAVTQTALVYTMYVRINRAMGISLSENKLRALAGAVVGNIAGNATAYLTGTAIATAASFIPGLGSGMSMVIMGGIGYAMMVVSAVSYGAIISRVKSGEMENMSEKEIKDVVAQGMEGRNVNREMKDLMSEYRQRRKDGSITGQETVTPED